MKKYLLIFFLLFFHSAMAATSIDCSPIKAVINNKMILLGPEAKTAKVYFLKNISSESLWIDHPVARPSASAGWASYLRPGNWAAIIVDRKNFAISCVSIQPGKVNAFDCGQVISVCSPAKIDIHKARKGTYWLVEDQPAETFLTVLDKRLK